MRDGVSEKHPGKETSDVVIPVHDEFSFWLASQERIVVLEALSAQECLGLVPNALGHNRSRFSTRQRGGLPGPRLHTLNIASLFRLRPHSGCQPALYRIWRWSR